MSVTVRGKKGSLIALLLDGNGRVTSSLGIEAYAMREGYDRLRTSSAGKVSSVSFLLSHGFVSLLPALSI